MAEAPAAVTLAEPPPRGLVRRLLVPLALLLAGAVAGAVGATFAPALLPHTADAPRPPAPKVSPLEYIDLENSFTANLKDTGRFVQVKIAVSTQGGQPVVEAVKRHHVALVAAVLGILADTAEGDLDSAGGRDALTKRMRITINDVLQRKSGIAGVDEVFLTSFILQ